MLSLTRATHFGNFRFFEPYPFGFPKRSHLFPGPTSEVKLGIEWPEASERGSVAQPATC